MEFKKNELINKVLDKHFETWSHTLNTVDFVSKNYLKKIDKLIFKNFKKKWKQVEIFYLLYLREKGYKLSLFQKLLIFLSGLEPIYNNEKSKKHVSKHGSGNDRTPGRKKRSEVVKEMAESEPQANE